MQVLAHITLNFQQPNFVTVYAAQNDRLSRYINAALLDGSTVWTLPAGGLMTVRYRKPDGTSGWYDTLEDGSPAYTVDEDGSITFGLAEQALTVPGMVPMELNFYNAAGSKLSTLTFIVAVKPSAYSDEDIASSDYYNILTARMQELAELADSAEEDYQEYLSALSGFVGAPRTAAVAADMLDTGLIYVYTGSETGWTYGDWYYYDGHEWTSGGVYNSAAISLDDTLTNANKPAQAKAAGDLVLVQDTQPAAPVNKLWFPLTEPEDAQVPTWEEFNDLKSSITNLEGGTTGQVLRKKSNTDYDTEWTNVGTPTDAQVESAVDTWLDEHPEATTTVQDGAITIPKLAEDVAETIQPLTALSESDGAANTALLNELLATTDVKLKPGMYPLHGTVTVDGVTLDLNGATLFRDEYISGEAIFIIKGTDPCIKNGTIVGTYDGSTSGSESGILFQSADNAQLSGLTIKNCRSRGISCDLNEVYGSRVIVRSAADYSSYVHYSADIPVQSGFKFVRTVGGYGFNAVYTVEFVTYIFKDGNGNALSELSFPPSFPCPVPQDAATVTVLTRTGAMGIEDGFVPYNIGFTNYNNRCCIRDCTILDCKNWAIANLFGESEICGLYTNCGIDIEDHEGVNLVIKDSRIDANTYVTSFYGRYYNTYFKNISIRAGASHSFVDCSGILTKGNASHAYMEPAISLIGGDMLCLNYSYNTDSMDAFNRKSLLITNGVIMTGDWDRINSLFGQNGFLYRQQSFHTHDQVCKGVISGTIVLRAEDPLAPSVSLCTSVGSNLVLYFDREALSRQNSLIAVGNCYGLHFVNGIVYPNGYTIFDSSFRPQGNAVTTRSAEQLLGTYVNCRFDASDYHIIATNKSDVEITFINCVFDAIATNKIVANSSYSKRMKLYFTNCVFLGVSINTAEDVATYIVSNDDAVVTIDGNVI